MTVELSTVADLAAGFDKVQMLRDILDSVNVLKAHCAGDDKILKALQNKSPVSFESVLSDLEAYSIQLSDHIDYMSLLLQRIANIIDLV